MRGVFLGLVLFASCAEPPPAPVVVPAPLVIAPIDAGPAVAVAARDAGPVVAAPACVRSPCLVTHDVFMFSVVGTELWMIRDATLGPTSPAPLLHRGRDDTSNTEVLADLRPSPTARRIRMYADANGVAFLSSEGITVWNHAQLTTIHTSTTFDVHEMALDGPNVYFIGRDCVVKKVPRAGGAVAVLAKLPLKGCWNAIMTFDDADLFVALDRSIYAVPRAGAAARVVATFKPNTTVSALVADKSSLYALTVGPVSPGIPGGAIHRVAKNGGGVVELARSDTTGPTHALAIDDTRLFWFQYRNDQHAVLAMPKDGSAPPATLAEGDGYGYAIAVGSDSLYWASRSYRTELRRLQK